MATLEFPDASVVVQHLGVTPGQRIGDFGVGGAAVFALPIAQRVGPEGQVLMFDVKKSALSGALSMAKLRGATNCQAVWSNLEIYQGAAGVADNSLDAGILINVLSQSTKYKDIVAETSRMIKSGGKLLVVDWKPEADSKLAPSADRRVADGRVEQVARDFGLTTLDRFEAGANHWGLVLVKT